MQKSLIVVLVLSTLAAAGGADAPTVQDFHWKAWQALPVQDGGRRKPLDSLAWQTWRLISNRATFTDPETGQKLDATAMYLATLLDWQGWDRPASPHSMAGHAASPHHSKGGAAMHGATRPPADDQPDKWDRCPLILVESLAMRKAIGMAKDQKYISPLDLSHAEFRDPEGEKAFPFAVWTQHLGMREERTFSPLEKEAVEVASRLRAFQEHRAGRGLEVVPLPGSDEQQWASVNFLMLGKLDDKTDPGGMLRRVRDQFQKVRQAYLAKSSEAFDEASAAFLAAVRDVGPKLGDYPSQEKIDLEVAYNHWVPFRFAWVFMLIACLCVSASTGAGWNLLYGTSFVAYGAGLVAMLVGFGMRIGISGRAPVTNMYESVIYVGLGVAALGLILELVYGKRYILIAAATVSTLTLILADNCPAILDPNLQPLQPVLRNNFWLVTHVMTITLSYAAFALALGIANITLSLYLVGADRRDLIAVLSHFTYRTLQIGIVLLAVGTVTGGIWADYSWGRFWGWDPKEVWALIALLVYLAVLHARYVGWVGHRGLAALSVVCFSLVVMAWYGVNILMGTGLHSYGFSGSAGQSYVAAAIAAQLVYVLVAMMRSAPSEPA